MADNEERLVLSADVSKLIKPLEQGANLLNKFTDLVGRTDSELLKLEGQAGRMASKLSSLSRGLADSGTSASTAAKGYDRYADGANRALSALTKLEAAQQKRNQGQLSAIPIPTGRNPVTQKFESTDPAKMSNAQLQNIVKAYDTQRQTLESVTRAELARRKAVDAAEAATRRSTATQHENTGSLISARYALYDVATTYGILSTVLLGASALAIKTGADFESAFTSVERTLEDGQTPAAISAIRSELVDLSTTIPKSFDEISQIATLGNQLGISAGQLSTFTETVAQFSTITGITAEASAQAFGRIGNLLQIAPAQYSNLASAITYVGRTSAATESQIIALTERLGATATRAGFTADQIVGLAGALGSLGVAPERAQGVFETYFNTLNEAVAEGGDSLQNFATITGLTTEAISDMVRSGQGFEVFKSFLSGLQGADTVELTTALSELGLTGLRANEVIGRISQNLPLLETAFENSSKAFSENTEIASQYAKIQDDLNTQFQLLINSLNALVNDLSGGLTPSLSAAVSELVEFVNQLRIIAQDPTAQKIAQLVLVLGTITGVLFAIRSASALATASTYALITAQKQLAIIGNKGGIKGLVTALFGLTSATTASAAASTAFIGPLTAQNTALSATAINANRAATGMRLLGGGLAVVAAGMAGFIQNSAMIAASNTFQNLQLAANGLVDVNTAVSALNSGSADQAGKNLLILGAGVDGATTGLAGFVYESDKFLASLTGGIIPGIGATASRVDELKQKLAENDAAFAASVNSGNVADFEAAIEASGASAAQAAANYPQLVAAIQNVKAAMASGGDVTFLARPTVAAGVLSTLSKGIDTVGKSAGGAAPKVRTLVDYANDLGTVFSRAFDIRFGSQLAIDQVTSSFSDLADRVRDAQTELLKLTADRNVKEYFLSIANAYGDTLRAGVLTGEIAEINDKISETQADASTELVGNSKAAIRNRKAMTGLVGEYQDYIKALAESGADQDTLNAAVSQSKNDFIAQATALGYSNAQLQPYIASFTDMATVIAKIPRNVTVTFNGDPALLAINEFMAKARAAVSGGIGGLGVNDTDIKKLARGIALLSQISYMKKQEAATSSASASQAISNEIRRLTNLLNSGSYAEGGFTGAGGKYQPAGIVHRGEYVIPKEGVNQRTGMPYGDYMGRISQGYAAPKRGYASGGFVGGDGFTEFGSWERRVLMQIARNTAQQPVIGIAPVAQGVNAYNANGSSRRSA